MSASTQGRRPSVVAGNDANGGATIRIEAQSRWDDLSLAGNLHGYSWHLLQTAPDRWYVCLRKAGSADDLPEDLVRRLQQWLRDRALPAALIRSADREYLVECDAGELQ